jgi:hypothetical protein
VRLAIGALHGALAKKLADKIKSADATAADMALAHQFLKNNGIDPIPTMGSLLGLGGELVLPRPRMA